MRWMGGIMVDSVDRRLILIPAFAGDYTTCIAVAVKPREVAAETIIDGMERNKFQVYIGKDASMMNFLYRINPRWATNFMFKQMKTLLPD